MSSPIPGEGVPASRVPGFTNGSSTRPMDKWPSPPRSSRMTDWAARNVRTGDDETSDIDEGSQTSNVRFLSPTEWRILARGVGGLRLQDTDEEHQTEEPVHPGSGWWPASRMPPGLYRSVVSHRAKFIRLFHAASISRWLLMVLQLLIGAVLTALGPSEIDSGVPITILGAANTIIAGLLALLHNSGIPDRYRNDMMEFDEVEDHLRELLESGIAPADLEVDQIVAECFDLYHKAKATVTANKPVTYISGSSSSLRREHGVVKISRSTQRRSQAVPEAPRGGLPNHPSTEAGGRGQV